MLYILVSHISSVNTGSLALEMNVMLNHFIYVQKYLSLEYLNEVILNFELGFMEQSDRPSSIDSRYIKDTSERKLGQSGLILIYHDAIWFN